MCPWASSQTLWVLPYLMLDGSWPQSWMHSYLCSPSPRIGYLVPVLSSALINGATAPTAPAAARKLRRVVFILGLLLQNPVGTPNSGIPGALSRIGH